MTLPLLPSPLPFFTEDVGAASAAGSFSGVLGRAAAELKAVAWGARPGVSAAGAGRGESPGELGGESSSSVTGLRAFFDPAPAGVSPPAVVSAVAAECASGAAALMSAALG